MDENKNLIVVLVAVVLVILGFLFVPKIINKFSNRIYKKMDKEEIDFDNLGPEIVKKDEGKEK